MNVIDFIILKEWCGCVMYFYCKEKGYYIGKVELGKNCLVLWDGKFIYFVSEVEVD